MTYEVVFPLQLAEKLLILVVYLMIFRSFYIMQMIAKNKISKIFRDFNNEILEELIPKDMVVPILRLKFSMQNLSWLCRNLQIRNDEHPEIKQTMAKLNTLRMKILLGK